MLYITVLLAVIFWVVAILRIQRFRLLRLLTPARRQQRVGVEQWTKEQRNIASFGYAGETTPQQRLRLRARENRRLRAAFGITNSLTTESLHEHKAFLTTATRLVNNKSRNWETLYGVAERFLQAELRTATTASADKNGQRSLRLAESVRCMVLAVVLFDNFGIDPATIPRDALVTITEEINTQWLRSKCAPDVVLRSGLLNATIDSLHLTSPSPPPFHPPPEHPTATEVLSLLMPQYETLWRVVLLTFATAYHHQPGARQDAEQRTAAVPSCLGGGGDRTREKEALKLAKEGLRLYPSNKHLYRSPALLAPRSLLPRLLPRFNNHRPPLAADISALHRHPGIWGNDHNNDSDDDAAHLFRPSRFDDDKLTPAQREAYIPFSVGKHKCPAGAASGFGERMVTLLVVALGRRLGPSVGRVQFGGRKEKEKGKGLPTGRDEMEGWRFWF
ncbi:uncharacterized protein B0T15DRAFT_400694 [Chaetomium strumarium]|uniref:Cytochrome P450 n=1 Tax=Chaetomium strumarium TaxID=1170767 RepID=A0AAJ0GQE6_9PEZI|nr:hypothetical protein B0T15DRAFT_400694 [Chaetomium strumarium]